MKKTFFAAVALTLATTLAHGAMIDFNDSQFNNTFVIPGPYTTVVTFDVVDFGVAAVARGADGFRRANGGQNFGVSGNGLFSLAFSTTQDVIFTSLTGRDLSNIDQDTVELPFDLLVDGTAIESGHQFTSVTSIWDFDDISVSAGSVFTIREVGTSDPNSRAVISALNFELADARVPLPASFSLMLAGLGALAVARKRRIR